MIRRLYFILVILTLPMALAGCPDDDLGDEIEEAAEEIEDEIDDAF
jgi:hypothetical protein